MKPEWASLTEYEDAFDAVRDRIGDVESASPFL